MINQYRRNFILALILFVGWVGSLTLLASFSGQPPKPKGVAELPQ